MVVVYSSDSNKLTKKFRDLSIGDKTYIETFKFNSFIFCNNAFNYLIL